MSVLIIIASIVVLLGFTAFFGAPYVPSHKAELGRAFRELRPLSKQDVVVDLGCGDGVVLRMAVAAGVGRAVGIELNPLLVGIAKIATHRTHSIAIQLGDMWHTAPPEGTTVVYVFGVGRDMEKLEALLASWAQKLQKPIDLVLYGHTLPGQKPARTVGAHHVYQFLPLQTKKAQV